MKTKSPPKPTVELTGSNGNAYAVIAGCRKAARRAGWSDKKWAAVEKEMTSGNYDNLLSVAMRHFDVE